MRLFPPEIADVCEYDTTAMLDVDFQATLALRCGDGGFADPDGPHHGGERQDVPYWRGHLDILKNQSFILGPTLFAQDLVCSKWLIQPKWLFKGPFTTPPADPGLKDDVPAAPILFTSSRLDPVTPLHSAHLMSNYHPGSAVLIHDTVGHPAMSANSDCYTKAIRAYFDRGIMPANGTVCDPKCNPFSREGACSSSLDVTGKQNFLFGFGKGR